MRYILVLAALALLAPPAPQTAPTLRVEDTGGAPLKDELVILQNLDDHEREMLRALTDRDGNVPVPDLKPGLYRAIATAPYGLWETQIREFFVAEGRPLEVILYVKPMATHGNGDIVTIGAPVTELQVLDSTGSPVSGAAVLVRDREATLYLERWYLTNAKGSATIELVGSPTVVVVTSQKLLTTTEILKTPPSIVVRLPKD
jgi:hypothetical protein